MLLLRRCFSDEAFRRAGFEGSAENGEGAVPDIVRNGHRSQTCPLSSSRAVPAKAGTSRRHKKTLPRKCKPSRGRIPPSQNRHRALRARIAALSIRSRSRLCQDATETTHRVAARGVRRHHNPPCSGSSAPADSGEFASLTPGRNRSSASRARPRRLIPPIAPNRCPRDRTERLSDAGPRPKSPGIRPSAVLAD